MSKYIAIPYVVGQDAPSVPIRDLVDTPVDFRTEAFKNTFKMIFDDVRTKDIFIKSGRRCEFGDFVVHDRDKSLFVYFTKAM